MLIVEILASVLLLSGALLAVLAGLGLLRLPDIGSRLQAVTKLQILGLALIAAGAAPFLGSPSEAVTLLLVVLFQLVTAPVLAQLIGHAAYRGDPRQRHTLMRDELPERDTSARPNRSDTPSP